MLDTVFLFIKIQGFCDVIPFRLAAIKGIVNAVLSLSSLPEGTEKLISWTSVTP